MLAMVAAVSGYGQEATKDDPKTQTRNLWLRNSKQKRRLKTTCFQPQRERFNRYVKNTVGPFRLVVSAASAGIDQWRDRPEEWGQGMKGYGRAFCIELGPERDHTDRDLWSR